MELQSDLLGAVEALADDSCADALADLANHLPDSLVPRAVHALRGLPDYAIDTAIARLAVRLGRMGEWQEMLRLLAAWPVAQPDTFAALAPDLPQHCLATALDLAIANEDPMRGHARWLRSSRASTTTRLRQRNAPCWSRSPTSEVLTWSRCWPRCHPRVSGDVAG